MAPFGSPMFSCPSCRPLNPQVGIHPAPACQCARARGFHFASPSALPSDGVISQAGPSRAHSTQNVHDHQHFAHPYRPLVIQPDLGRPYEKYLHGRMFIFPLDVVSKESSFGTNANPAAYRLPHGKLPSLADRFCLLGRDVPFHVTTEEVRSGHIWQSLMNQLQAWFNTHGLQMWTTSMEECKTDRPRVRMLTTGKEKGLAYFRQMARDTDKLEFKHLFNAPFKNLPKEGVKVWLCPDGPQLFIVSIAKHLPKSASDPAQQLPLLAHPCSAVRFHDALEGLDDAVPPTVAGRCTTICSKLYPMALSDAKDTLWKPIPAWRAPQFSDHADLDFFEYSHSMWHRPSKDTASRYLSDAAIQLSPCLHKRESMDTSL
ncbi:hypothetical protein AURDEDRAFT_154588 [Auricularia subglabra TFB-10046 SS5]|nr:hypothetical protein AURDEDRAFT_154588 [Auricularia subglabra TFB-10046 SS5]